MRKQIDSAAKDLAVEAGCLLAFLKANGIDINEKPFSETQARVEKVRFILGREFMEADEIPPEIRREPGSVPYLDVV
jgi:hypothetical protein